MIKIIVTILLSLIVGINTYAQTKVNYRTLTSGDWSNPGIWQTSENGVAWSSATKAPDQQTGSIEISSTHKVTITSLIVANQVIVAANAEIQIKPSGILLIQNLASVIDMRIYGMVINEGTYLPINGALLFFEDHSSFVHHRNGGVIPTAQWSQTSTTHINAVSDLPVTGLDQRFGTLIWNSANRVPISLASSHIQGSLIIQNGNPSHPFWLRPSSGTLYIAGDLILSDPAYVVFGGTSPQVIHIGGDYSFNGGVFEVSGEEQLHQVKMQGNFVHSGGRLRTTGNGTALFLFSNPEGHNLTTGGIVEGNIRYEVSPGANISFTSSDAVLQGRSFRLLDEAHIEISAPSGITNTSKEGHIQTTDRYYSEKAHYYYTGVNKQNTGDGLPNHIQSLTLDNHEGLVLTGNRTVKVNEALMFVKGSLNTAASTIALQTHTQLIGTDEQRYIIGSLLRTYPVGEQVVLSFPIGDPLRYSPLTVTLSKVVQEGQLRATTSVLSEVPVLTNGELAEHYIDRKWLLSGLNPYFDSYTIQLSYSQDEQVGHYFPDSIWVREFVDGKWVIADQTLSTNQTLEIGPFTRFSTYMIGWDDDSTTTVGEPEGITGLLFEDENANGFADPEDYPRSKITLELRTETFNVISTTITNDNGWFAFPEIDPGTYKLVVSVPENRKLSTAASPVITLKVTESNPHTRLEIGLYEPLRLDGKIDLGPPSDRYASEPIYIKGYFRGYLGMPAELPNTIRDGETALFSDTLEADGSYRIAGVRPGYYLVQLELPPYWTMIAPNPQFIEVRKNAITAFSFTPQLDELKAPLQTNGVISGLVFEELVQLGSRQAEVEPVLEDIKLTLTGTDVRGATIERTTRTDDNGYYRFNQLPEGLYRVEVQAEKPFQATFPEPGRHSLYIKGSEKIGQHINSVSVPMASTGTYPIFGHLRIGLDTLLNNRNNRLLSFSGQGNIALQTMNGGSRTLKLLDFSAIDLDSNGVRTSIRLPGVYESTGMWQSGTLRLTSGLEMSIQNKIYQITEAITLSGFLPSWPLQHTVLVHYPDPSVPIVNPFGETIAVLRSIELVAMSGLDFGLFDLRNLDSIIIAKKIPDLSAIAQETLPREIALGQNYPNPFNPTTVIPFSLPVTMPVKLHVFDVTGRLVQVLLNETKSAGRHEITFKAGDLPSGVYFVTLDAGGKVFTKKISLLK